MPETFEQVVAGQMVNNLTAQHFRRLHGVTQAQLARTLEVCRRTVARWEGSGTPAMARLALCQLHRYPSLLNRTATACRKCGEWRCKHEEER